MQRHRAAGTTQPDIVTDKIEKLGKLLKMATLRIC